MIVLMRVDWVSASYITVQYCFT